jgi:hypothetical protein
MFTAQEFYHLILDPVSGFNSAAGQVEMLEHIFGPRFAQAQRFLCGDNLNRVNQRCGALRCWIEETNARHLIAEKLDPRRQVAGGGIDVDDAPATTEAPGHLHHVLPLITDSHPPGKQLIDSKLHPLPDSVDCSTKIGRG